MLPVPRRTSPAALLFVVGLAFFTDSVLYYLLVPLLPHYAKTLGLSQMEVGVLFGAYASAILAGTWPRDFTSPKYLSSSSFTESASKSPASTRVALFGP